MARELLHEDRGVSLMIGYVLLIAIAVSLSIAVFFYLKLYLPSENPECDENIDLTIDEASCVSVSGGGGHKVLINVTNRGLFNVDSAFIKMGDADRVFKNVLKDPTTLSLWSETDPKCDVSDKLKPGEKFCGEYNYNLQVNTQQEISLEPIIYIDNKLVICSKDIVKKVIICV